ncbi:Negative regulator of sexual conjugation and meiosis [Mycena venus]|uniref:Negative regulator of sexual conjugation and meiosis n=1 Tax=Mycena venus TaxID=2733690 RepID=A0A8H7CF92_9AGAR|nr:Negative regulator of sexual conjugation and meiosis [Mycena venus]
MRQSGTLRNLTGRIVDDGRLELVNIIGAGAYGKLYKARDTTSPSSSPTFYAVKCLRRPALSSKDAKFQDRERALHRRVSCHPNIVTLHRHFVDPEHVYLVMDLCIGGDMYGAILDGVYYRQTALIKRTFASLVDAVRFCHSRNVFHRDLKPENVLVSYDGRNALIADFGLSTESRISRDVDCGSGSYMCPGMSHSSSAHRHRRSPILSRTESFGAASSQYCPQHSDTWALCIILINLVTAMNPWQTAQPTDVRWRSFTADPAGYLREILPISRPLNELLSRCFRIDPARRPTLTQLRHEILSMPELFMSDDDLGKASPGVRRAAGCAVTEEGAGEAACAYDPSDFSFDTPSGGSSGSGYSSLDAHIGRPVNFPATPVGLAPPASSPSPAAGGSRSNSGLLTVPALTPASRSRSRSRSRSIPSESRVPDLSNGASSEAESAGPLTPQAHLVHLPAAAASSSGQQDHIDIGAQASPNKGKGKFRRFVRRLRVWRKL